MSLIRLLINFLRRWLGLRNEKKPKDKLPTRPKSDIIKRL